ncbi:MAG: transcriptional regulator [Bacteroidetes bacterium]|nr:MAG: transcriptional regulator [Bacteroidota bacterium]PTM10064.1 MAG: transcriptional regulator [Bacteroidota bacterium]
MFSKTCKYGLRAVLYLASQAQEDHKLGVKQVAAALEVPQPFLAKLLQQLARVQIISSAKGPNGGFYLSDKNLVANLRQVVECLDGPDVFSSCILGLPSCSSANPCPLHQQAVAYRNSLLDVMERQTIREVAQRIGAPEYAQSPLSLLIKKDNQP